MRRLTIWHLGPEALVIPEPKSLEEFGVLLLSLIRSSGTKNAAQL
jgi:hypothetical protein